MVNKGVERIFYDREGQETIGARNGIYFGF